MKLAHKFLEICKVLMVIFIIIGTVFNNLNCEYKSKKTVDSGINLISSYPIINIEGAEVRLSNARDTIRITYSGQRILYEFFRKRVYETDRPVQGEHEYFVYNIDSATGFLFHDPPGRIHLLGVDSVLKEKGMGRIRLEPGVNDSLISELYDGDNLIINKFIPKHNNPKYFDTLLFYFDKNLLNIMFSFSRKMDSLGKGKLFKVRLIQNEEFNKDLKVLTPRREYYFEIQKMTHSDLIKYLEVLGRFYEQNKIHEAN